MGVAPRRPTAMKTRDLVVGASRALLLSLAAFLPASQATAGEEAFERWRGEAVVQLVEELEGLAAWCQGERMYACRDRTYEAILRFHPDNARARRTLKYRRSRDGSWEQSSSYRPARDRGKAGEGYARRRASIAASFGKRILALADGVDAARRREIMDVVWTDLLILDPDDKRARAARGEVRDAASGGWILAESAVARDRRARLAARAAELVGGAGDPGLAFEEVRPEERELEIAWRGAVRSRNLRVAGTCGEDLLYDCARRAQAALELFLATCGSSPSAPEDLTLYVLASEADADAFLQRHPGFDAEHRGRARGFSSYWVPRTHHLAIWPCPEDFLLEEVVRQTVALLLVQQYGISPEVGWAWEGFVEHFVEFLTVAPGSPAAGGSEAHRRAEYLRESCERQDWGSLLARPARTLGGDGRACSRVLAGYLIDGHPERVRGILSALGGSGSRSAGVLEGALGMNPTALQARTARWVVELSGGE